MKTLVAPVPATGTSIHPATRSIPGPRRARPPALLPVLLLAAAVSGVAASGAGAVEPVGARHPALSPDATSLAFDWRGDIWVVSSEGGRARRLTVHTAHDARPRWSPDG
ncbi:MAG: hypothetical protein PVF43_14400, partial [Candidatus Eiseniibacteriota bacterium]